MPHTHATLDALIQHNPQLWRGGDLQQHQARRPQAESTGHHNLDAALPTGGWPQPGIVEVLHNDTGVGEVELFIPSLAKLTQKKRQVVFVGSPHRPYSPALAQAGVRLEHLLWIDPPDAQTAHWVIETALRSRACGMVLAWPGHVDVKDVRRWQVAAEEGKTLGVLLRTDQRSSPNVNLRLQAGADAQGRYADVLKARGMHQTPRVRLS